jgi:hypothetical protein
MSTYVKIPTMFSENEPNVEDAGFEDEGARPSSAPPLFSQAKEGATRSDSFSVAKEQTLIESGVEDIRSKPNYPEFYEKHHHLFNLPPPFDPAVYKLNSGKQALDERNYVDDLFVSVSRYILIVFHTERSKLPRLPCCPSCSKFPSCNIFCCIPLINFPCLLNSTDFLISRQC